MILDRYLLKEILKVWSVILTILVLIGTSHKLVRLIGKAASGDLSPTLLLQVIGFQVPDLIAFMLPLALFLAILLVISRSSVDQEFVAMLSVGVPWRRLTALCLGVSLIVMMITGYLTLYLVPYVTYLKEKLIQQEESVALLQTLSPGHFYSFKNDSLVFYVEDLTDEKQLREVFIAEQPISDPKEKVDWTVVSAQDGQILTNPSSGHVYVELKKGHRYDGSPGFQEYMTIDFDTYGKLIEKKRAQEGLYYYSSMPTHMLIGEKNTSFIAELQMRISQALSAPILALMALPLARVGVRKGRFHRILPAVLLFILYFCLLTMCKRWIVQGSLPGSIGMWWVHALAILLGFWLLLNASGKWQQWAYSIKVRYGKKA